MDKQKTRLHYTYYDSPDSLWHVVRDGKILSDCENEGECWTFLHRIASGSVDHSLRYEGYRILKPRERPCF